MNCINSVIIKKITIEKYPLLITLCFFLIISYVAFFQNNLMKDGGFFTFAIQGEQILLGNGENVRFMSGPPIGAIIFALSNLPIDNFFVTGKIFSLLSGTGIVFFSYYIIRNIFDHKTAIIGQLLVALNPRVDITSIQVMNELPQVFFIFAALYFGTKKDLKLSDIIIVGLLIGAACLFRYQAIIVLFGYMIFILIRSKKIRINLSYVVILGIFFMIAFSPVLIYNYSTHGVLIDNNANYELVHKSKFNTPDWIEELKINAVTGTPTNFFIDLDLFFKNYFYNLFYHNPDKLFYFNSISNFSIIPSIPFLGFILFAGGLIYLSKIKLDKSTIITLIGITSIIASLVLLLGDIEIHFFAIIIFPLLAIVIRNIRKIQKNFLPLLLISIVFLVLMSTFPLSSPDHFFSMWFIFPTVGAVFFIQVIPTIFSQIKYFKKKFTNTKSYNKTIIIIILLILFVNLVHSYKSIENYLYEQEPFSTITNEITKQFQRTEPLVERGMETKQIAEILAKQPEIKNSYVMATFNHYLLYVDTNHIMTTYQEGVKNDPIEKFLTRENWSDFDHYASNDNDYPPDRHNKNKPYPDYVIYSVPLISNWKYDIYQTQYDDLKILTDPSNPKIPSNFELLYKSNKTSIVLYKINHAK